MKEMSKEELPDVNIAQEFYSKYEPKEVLGRYVYLFLLQISNKICVAIAIFLFCNWQLAKKFGSLLCKFCNQ